MYRVGLRAAAALALTLAIIACLAHHARAEEGAGSYLNIERIERDGVSMGPWAAAWSPDGRCLAYIRKSQRVHVRCVGEETWDIKVRNAQAILWRGDGLLYALVLDPKGRASLVNIDTVARKPGEPEQLPDHTAIVHEGPRGELAMVTWFSELSIGVNVFSEIHAMAEGGWKSVFKAGRLSPLKVKGMDYIKGWMYCGPNPLDGSFLLSEYIDPPALNPYMKVVLVDSADYSRTDLIRISSGPISLECSWSPSGQRAAIADVEGHLRLLDLEGQLESLEDGTSGCCPSWNPTGASIYFGGQLIDVADSGRTELLPDAQASRAWWSPDADSLAIASDGALFIVRKVGSVFDGKMSMKDRPLDADTVSRAGLLRELLDEGLLTKQEYDVRMQKLRQSVLMRKPDEK